MRNLTFSLCALAWISGCSGDDGKSADDECEELAPIDVNVTVNGPDGAEIVPNDATIVRIDGVDCTVVEGATFLCVAQPEADNQLSIIDTRYDVYAAFLTELVFECEAGTLDKVVQLDAMMGS